MADKEDPRDIPIEQVKELDEVFEHLYGATGGVNSNLDIMRDRLDGLGDTGAERALKKAFDQANDGAQKFQGNIKGIGSFLDNLKKDAESAKLAERIMGGGDIQAGAQKAALSLIGKFKKQLKEAGQASKAFGQGMDAAFGIAGTSITKNLVENFNRMELMDGLPSLDKIQSQLMSTQKQLAQTGQSFSRFNKHGDEIGGTYTNATKNIGHFNEVIGDTILTTRRTQEEVMGVHKALAKAFGDQVTAPISSLSGTVKGVSEKVTNLNAALLISTAKGMDAASVAQIMSDAHLKLGVSTDKVAEEFGYMQKAARGSGLEFESVANSIASAAKTLRYYGTTAKSVTPIFQSFNKSLRGIGREGLTPELIGKYVSGLKQMSFGARALVGLQMPGAGGAGGAIGAGLQFEEALKTGEGMGDIAQGIKKTLEQFGGPLVTRKEALESPERQTQYMLQRQFLGQQFQGLDTGEQDIMLGLLRDVERGGPEAKTAESELRDLLEAGKQTADDTTTAIEKASQREEAAIQKLGDRFEVAISDMFAGSPIQKFVQTAQNTSEQLARGIRDPIKVTMEGIKDFMGSLGDQEQKLIDKLGNLGPRTTRKERAGLERQLMGIRTQRLGAAATGEFQSNLKKAITDAIKSGKVSEEQGRRLMEQYESTGTISRKERKAGPGQDIWQGAMKESLSGIDERRDILRERIKSIRKDSGRSPGAKKAEINKITRELDQLKRERTKVARGAWRARDTAEPKGRGRQARESAEVAYEKRQQRRAAELDDILGAGAPVREPARRRRRSPQRIVRRAREEIADRLDEAREPARRMVERPSLRGEHRTRGAMKGYEARVAAIPTSTLGEIGTILQTLSENLDSAGLTGYRTKELANQQSKSTKGISSGETAGGERETVISTPIEIPIILKVDSSGQLVTRDTFNAALEALVTDDPDNNTIVKAVRIATVNNN